MEEFWISFWPNLASTVIGIIIGFPVAVWLNKLALSYTVKKQQESDKTDLHRTLNAVGGSIDHNTEKLTILLQAVGSGHFLIDTGFDTASWQAYNAQLARLNSNIELNKQLISYHERISNLTVINSKLCNNYLGLESSLSGANKVREFLRGHIMTEASKLSLESANIRASINTVCGIVA